MGELTPPRSKRARQVAGQALTWPQVAGWYRRVIAEHHWQFETMLSLVEGIAASPAGTALFPTISMGRLLVTDGPTFYFDDNVLFISYDQSTRQFEFEHRTLARHDDRKICAESEAMQTLELFLRYKYGVLLQTASGHALRRTASAPSVPASREVVSAQCAPAAPPRPSELGSLGRLTTP